MMFDIHDSSRQLQMNRIRNNADKPIYFQDQVFLNRQRHVLELKWHDAVMQYALMNKSWYFYEYIYVT